MRGLLSGIAGLPPRYLLPRLAAAALVLAGLWSAAAALAGRDCSDLDTACLARAAGRSAAEAAKRDEAHRLRDPALPALYRAAGLDAARLMPLFETIDQSFRPQYIAQLVYFGGAESLRDRMEREIGEQSRRSEGLKDRVLSGVAAVEAATGHEAEARARIAAVSSPEKAPAAHAQLAVLAARRGDVAEATALAGVALVGMTDPPGGEQEFQTVRALYRAVGALAKQDPEAAKALALRLTGSPRASALAHAGALREALAEARRVGEDYRNIPLGAVAAAAAGKGDRATFDAAVEAMTGKSYSDEIAIAWARGAAAFREPDLLNRARFAIGRIPVTATSAIADAQAAVAVAQARLGAPAEAWEAVRTMRPAYERVAAILQLAAREDER